MPLCSRIIIYSLISSVLISLSDGYNPCCSYPCQNHGICMPTGENLEHFECDCTGTGYFGKHCQRPSWGKWIRSFYALSTQTKTEVLTGYPMLWHIVNANKYLHRKLITYVYRTRSASLSTPHLYNVQHGYTTLDVYYNRSFYARELPPVPCDCPTAMGVLGPEELPPVDEVYERILKRETFKYDRCGSNMILAAFANHFSQQFFKTDYQQGPGITYGNNEGVDGSQIYGADEKTRWALRSKINGKLKTRILNGEEFPPFLEDAPEVDMLYPQGKPQPIWREHAGMSQEDVTPKWAFGHAHFSRTPHLFVMATVWIREHNHVCDKLHKKHPRWDDERLYQTARLVITGEMLTIAVSEYLQHLTQYNLRLTYEPRLAHNTRLQYSNRIRHEFNHMYHWHQLVPDELHVAGTTYNASDLLFTNNRVIFEHGFDAWVEAMNSQVAGELTHHNSGPLTAPMGRHVLTEGRTIRLQSFNNYRRKFNLEPYTSFEQMTGDKELAQTLRDLYQDVEAVEFYVGLTVERRHRSVMSPSMLGMGGPWAIKGLMANPIGSPDWWRPSTFGGQEGFDIVRHATLAKLFCNNMRGRCKGFKIGFRVPTMVMKKLTKNCKE